MQYLIKSISQDSWIVNVCLLLRNKDNIASSPDFICKLKPRAEAITASTTVSFNIILISSDIWKICRMVVTSITSLYNRFPYLAHTKVCVLFVPIFSCLTKIVLRGRSASDIIRKSEIISQLPISEFLWSRRTYSLFKKPQKMYTRGRECCFLNCSYTQRQKCQTSCFMAEWHPRQYYWIKHLSLQ